MQIGNTYTWRQSELPQLTPEIQSKIAEIDCTIADFILKIQGNYHALNYLIECLDNNLDSCQLAVNSIRIVPDSYQQKPAGLLELPFEQKELVTVRSFLSLS